MRQIRFRKEAEADLRAIIGYYEETAPHAVGPILADIHRAIRHLVDFPRIGMQVEGRSYRRLVTITYHFKIAYEIDGEHVVILGIFRYQDRKM